MSVGAKVWRVGIIGLSPAGLFHLERLSLCPEIRLVGAFDRDPQRLALAADLGCPLWVEGSLKVELQRSHDIDAVFLVDGISVESVSAAMVDGLHVVIHRPWSFSSDQLQQLGIGATTTAVADAASVGADVGSISHDQAVTSRGTATIACVRRWSPDFAAAVTAKQTGRLGSLRSVRFSSREMRLPDEGASAGVLREFGYHWLDQLLILTESTPQKVFAKRLGDADLTNEPGFLAIIDFDNGCTAEIDMHSRSRLGYRTGWMLEGSSGSYRNDRLYTETADGEIIDEPLQRSALAADPFISELISLWRGEQTTLPTLADAACVMQLIEAIERSATSGEVVRISSFRPESRGRHFRGRR